jgi:hypothetical protein
VAVKLECPVDLEAPAEIDGITLRQAVADVAVRTRAKSGHEEMAIMFSR